MIEGVLTEEEVDEINASIDHMIPELNPSPSGAMGGAILSSLFFLLTPTPLFAHIFAPVMLTFRSHFFRPGRTPAMIGDRNVHTLIAEYLNAQRGSSLGPVEVMDVSPHTRNPPPLAAPFQSAFQGVRVYLAAPFADGAAANCTIYGRSFQPNSPNLHLFLEKRGSKSGHLI